MTLKPRAVLLVTLTAALGIAATWAGWLPLWWQVPAVAIATLIFLEFNEARASAFDMTLAQPARLGLGKGHLVSLTLRNRGSKQQHVRFCPVPPNGVRTLPRDNEAELAPGASGGCEFSATGATLGVHAWPLQPVEIHGRFGLARWMRWISLATESRVVPDWTCVQLNARGLAESGMRPQLKAGNAGEEVRGLREYSPGDPPSAIDWKATARSRELFVRETTHTQHVEIIVAIDAGQASGLACGQLSMLGHCVNVAARLLATAHLRGDRAGLLVFADRVIGALPTGHGIAHQQRLQDLLARTVTTAAESNPLPAIVELSRLAQRRSLIVIFSPLHDAEANGQFLRAIRLLRPKHMPLIVALRDPAIEALAAQPASDWLDPYRSLAALERLRDVRAMKQRLRRLGAEVVETVPDALGDTVIQRFLTLARLRRI